MVKSNQYIVVSNAGYYAERVLKQFPHYQGIDRCLWPLGRGDLERVRNLPDEQKRLAKNCLREMGEYGTWSIHTGKSIFCSDNLFVKRYVELCEILGVHAEHFIGRLYSLEEEKTFPGCVGEDYLFVGFDFVLSSGDYSCFDGTYSCLIQEKHLIDRVETIKLNENGLLCNLQDALRFGDLREQAREKYAGEGFEAGAEFDILALFRHL